MRKLRKEVSLVSRRFTERGWEVGDTLSEITFLLNGQETTVLDATIVSLRGERFNINISLDQLEFLPLSIRQKDLVSLSPSSVTRQLYLDRIHDNAPSDL
jgi:hypothetical protein